MPVFAVHGDRLTRRQVITSGGAFPVSARAGPASKAVPRGEVWRRDCLAQSLVVVLVLVGVRFCWSAVAAPIGALASGAEASLRCLTWSHDDPDG